MEAGAHHTDIRKPAHVRLGGKNHNNSIVREEPTFTMYVAGDLGAILFSDYSPPEDHKDIIAEMTSGDATRPVNRVSQKT